MKTKLLAGLLTLWSTIAFSQAVANPVPPITFCDNINVTETIDLTPYKAIALGDQDPGQYYVSFHSSNNYPDILFGLNAVNEIQNYEVYTGTPYNLYVKVGKIGDMWDYAVTTLVIHAVNFGLPWSYDHWVSCDSYILPVPQTVGGVTPQYYTGPNGTGNIIPPGTVVSQTSTVYLYATNGTCTAQTEVLITILKLPPGNPTPYIVCTPNGIPGTFDLTSKIPEILGGLSTTGGTVLFYTTEEAALDMVDMELPLFNETNYTATSAFQTIYYRVVSQMMPECVWVKPLILVTEPCTTNSVSGSIKLNYDSTNCASVTAAPASGIGISNIVGSNTYQTFTDANGNYSFNGSPDGDNEISVMQTQQLFAITPTSHTVTLPGLVTGKDFCLNVPNPVQDVQVSLIPVSEARPGFEAMYSLVYKNVGTIPASGSITVTFPQAKVSYVSSSPQLTVNGNSLTISYSNLLPFQSQYSYIRFLVQPPQIVPMGDILEYTAAITPETDNNAADNIFGLKQLVVNSYDPNDISVLEGATITEAQADGYLHYTIRFQNIGNADALRVRIESMLDSKLDYNTIQPVSASHAYHFERKNDKLTVRFDDIYLAGSQYDEPNSHGYITYRIKPNASVTIGDSMSANANIYFDFNDPIATNIVTTTVQAPAGTADFAIRGFAMYPNPANSALTLKLAETANADVIVTDVLGKTVLTSRMTAQEQNIDITSLTGGVYFVKVTAEGQSATKKLIVK